MAETFDVVAQRPGTEFLGGTETRDVMFIGIVTKPDGIYLEFAVPVSLYPAAVNAAALGWANIFETLAGLPHVAGVEWGQRVVNGQLQPQATITVASSSGDSTGQLTVLISSLGPKLDQAAIDKLHAQLDATEAL